MARFSGLVGYAFEQVETAPGVHADRVVERRAFGDVVRTTRRLQNGEQVNPSITLNKSISIVADAFARDNFMAIRFVVWAGVVWEVPSVDVEHPRLILELGGVYNGRRADPEPDPTPGA